MEKETIKKREKFEKGEAILVKRRVIKKRNGFATKELLFWTESKVYEVQWADTSEKDFFDILHGHDAMFFEKKTDALKFYHGLKNNF